MVGIELLFYRWTGLTASILLTATVIVVGCTGKQTKVDSYESLPENARHRVHATVERYIECSVNMALKIDKGRRHLGRLAWTASEACVNEKDDILRLMIKQGANYNAAHAHASDSQVEATAAAITAMQSQRAR